MGGVYAAVMLIWLMGFAMPQSHADESKKKRIIGATEEIVVLECGIQFRARIDTGAESCSINCPEFIIDEMSEVPRENIGKKIRFRIANHDDKETWLESVVVRSLKVKTTEGTDARYKVKLTLRWEELEKEVLVTLNDREKMKYPLLIGRNFLVGKFLVDVERNSDDE